MKKMITIMTTLVCALCTTMISTANAANTTSDTLLSQVIEGNGKTFIIGEDSNPIIEGEISSFVLEMKKLYKASSATIQRIDMNQSVQELQMSLIDSECVSVTDVDEGIELVTKKGNNEYVYSFDKYSPWSSDKSSNLWYWHFQYEDFEYIVFENDSQLAIAKNDISSNATPSYQRIDMNQSVQELQMSLIDSECVSVTDIDDGVELVTKKGNNEYVYSFDKYSPWPSDKSSNLWYWHFQYEDFEYIVFENDSQLATAKIARQ